MNSVRIIISGIVVLSPLICFGQVNRSDQEGSSGQNLMHLYGFVRGGLYGGIDHDNDKKPYIPSAFSDFGLKAEAGNGLNFNAFADLRFRYGVEFGEQVTKLDLREAFVRVYGKTWDISAGQKIIKWGRADFTNPTSNITPKNYIYRSPDREDMDMGNLLASINWFPAGFINIEAVAIPFYRSSVLIIDPVPLPDNVTIIPINSLITSKDMFSYGFKSNFHLRGVDWSFSWFDGHDPMPGIALTYFDLDLTGPLPVSSTELTVTPYKTRVLGLDFEATAGNIGIRGEGAWSVPHLSYQTNEYVPMAEINWVTGIDWSKGSWRFTWEYSGKIIPNFSPSQVDPVIGTEADFSKLAELLATPGFDMEDHVRQQVEAFNRLYNYQLEKIYHSAALRVEADLAYGRLTPSLFSLYNFTSHDFLLIPEIRFKPSDGLTITVGGEFFNGLAGSLYDIIDGFMNNIYASLRVDF